MTESTDTPTGKKLEELYELIDEMPIAMMTTRRPDAMLVSRPMDTQQRDAVSDLWFVTDIETEKVDELESDPHVCLAYYNDRNKQWVSVSGTVTITQDREQIRRLHKPDWNAWFPDEGGNRDGGPEDPRLALILVDAHTVTYMKAKHSKPVTLFKVGLGIATGTQPDVGRVEHLGPDELK